MGNTSVKQFAAKLDARLSDETRALKLAKVILHRTNPSWNMNTRKIVALQVVKREFKRLPPSFTEKFDLHCVGVVLVGRERKELRESLGEDWLAERKADVEEGVLLGLL